VSFAIIHELFAVYRLCNLIVNDFFNSKKRNPPFARSPFSPKPFFRHRSSSSSSRRRPRNSDR
jgi:hypothetical protein